MKSNLGPLAVIIAVILAMPVRAQPPLTLAETSAKQFALSLIEGGDRTKQFVTKDAMIIAGDIGGPLDELMRDEPAFAKTFAGCSVAASKELRAKVPDDSFGNPKLAKGRTLTQVDVKLECKAGASKRIVPVQVFVTGNRVVLFVMGNDQGNG